MAVRYCLNMGMEGIGIFVIGCCPKFWLADLLTNKAQTRDGYIIARVEGDYSKFIRFHLQGCLVVKTVLFFPFEVRSSSCIFLFHISAW